MAKVQQQGQKPAKNSEPIAVAEPIKSPFRHFVPGERPRIDQAYFELLLSKLLRSTGEFASFDEVWPGAVQALAGMNLLRLSTYSSVEVRDAIVIVGGDFNSRMNPHAESIIRWAQSFWRIRQIYGTFRRYLRSFEIDGFETVLEDLKVRLPGLSAEFLTSFLREAGEKVPAPEKAAGPRPPQQRGSSPADSRGDQQRRQPQPQQQQPPQEQPRQEGGRSDRRRRQRGHGGATRPQPQEQQAQKPLQAPPKAANTTTPGDDATKDSQQQRRRNRRRFFRRRRSGGGGENTGAPPPADS